MTTLEHSQSVPLARPRMTRIAVALVFFINGLALANWIARIPDVKQQLALSDGTLGIVLLCAAAGALIAQPVCGWAISRIGSRRMVIITLTSFCLSVMLPGLAPSVPLLMLALFILGGCNGALDVAMNAQAAQVEQHYGRPIMSSFHGLWSVGGLAGASIGGLAAASHISVATHLFTVACIAVVSGFIVTRWLIVDDNVHEAAGPMFALPPRSLLVMGLIAFCVLFSEGAISDWGAVYMRDALHSNPGLAALGYASFALLMAVGRLTGDWLTARFGSGVLVRSGGGLVTLGIALALVSTVPALAIVGFGLVGAGVSCIFPLILSAAARTPGIAPSTAIAAMATTGYTGFLVGPPLIGTLAEVLSLRGALGVLTLVGVLVIVFGGAVQRGTGAVQQ